MDREIGVRKALSDFLLQHNLHESVSCVDEVVLTYLLSILDDLGDTSSTDENVDAEHFCEMMAAYVPGFEGISSVEVWEWMFSLSGQLRDHGHTEVNEGCTPPESPEVVIGSPNGIGRPGGDWCKTRVKRDSHRSSQSEEDDARSHASDDVSGGEVESEVAMLCEMFPDTCTMEVRHCLSVSHGSTDEAVQLILHRQETGNAIIGQSDSSLPVKSKGCRMADKQLKELTLARYSFVDTDDDKKVHKPAPIKKESKKLIRYREGQVVSTKGEKFTEVKKNESEEMKKTYVSLKPARKYRFH